MGGYKKRLLRIITFLAGLYFFLEYMLPGPVVDALGLTTGVHEQISNGFILVGAMAFGLGIINLLLVHGQRIAFLRKRWGNSLVLLVGIFSMMIVSFTQWQMSLSVSDEIAEFTRLSKFARVIVDDAASPDWQTRGILPPSERNSLLLQELSPLLERTTAIVQQEDPSLDEVSRIVASNAAEEFLATRRRIEAVPLPLLTTPPLSPEALELTAELSGEISSAGTSYGKVLRERQKFTLTNQAYDFLYEGLFVALGSAMFSLLGAYIAVAAYRAFRLRSFEASLMMLAAVAVMLGQIPFGVHIFPFLPDLRLWLLEVPNSAAFRAIALGTFVAGLVMAFRMWLSIESESFIAQEDE